MEAIRASSPCRSRLDSPSHSRVHSPCRSPTPRSRRGSISAAAAAIVLSPTTSKSLARQHVESASPQRSSSPAGAAATLPQVKAPASDLGWSTCFAEEYILGKCVGSGAFGTVHLAVHRITGEEVAVKILSKTRAKQSREKTLSKLQREVEVLQQLSPCANVVKLLNKYEDDSFAYLVMEYCSGGDLEQLVEDHGCLSEEETALVIFECLKVIQAFHAANIVHGDVKPANFLIKPSKQSKSVAQLAKTPMWVKAIDFGCSQSVLPNQLLVRRTGTPIFMAPEVYNRCYSKQSDMWSLGMMMYHFLTRRFPFWESMDQCRSSTLDDVMRAVTIGNIPFNLQALTKLSPQGMEFLHQLLERNPAKRLMAEAAIEHPWFDSLRGQPEDATTAAPQNAPALWEPHNLAGMLS